ASSGLLLRPTPPTCRHRPYAACRRPAKTASSSRYRIVAARDGRAGALAAVRAVAHAGQPAAPGARPGAPDEHRDARRAAAGEAFVRRDGHRAERSATAAAGFAPRDAHPGSSIAVRAGWPASTTAESMAPVTVIGVRGSCTSISAGGMQRRGGSPRFRSTGTAIGWLPAATTGPTDVPPTGASITWITTAACDTTVATSWRSGPVAAGPLATLTGKATLP